MAETYRASLTAVVLSAGASRRFGGEPKALLPVDGERAGERIVRLAFESGCTDVVAVVGAHARELTPLFERAGARVVVNEGWEAGRTGSLQVGLGEVAAGDDVLLWPVDHPFAEAATVTRLRHAAERDSLALWFIPVHAGRGGHPVLLRSAVLSSVLSLPPSAPLRSLLPRLGVQVSRVPSDDPGIVEAVESPEEYRDYLSRWRSRRGG